MAAPTYPKRVVLVGAESTGKTVLAARLAEIFQTGWVREVGRDVTEKKISEAGGSIELITWGMYVFNFALFGRHVLIATKSKPWRIEVANG
jgi:nicotinamide riboside kinase